MDGSTSPAFDIDMIQRALELLVEPGTVVELRIPGTRHGTVSGYFNDLDAMRKCAVSMSGKAEGVYLTLNPAFSDLLARGSNKLVRYAKHATSDE